MLSNIFNLWNLLIIFMLVFIAWYFVNQYKKKRVPVKEPLRGIHIFPDYPKAYPFECKSGTELQFVARGFSDFTKLTEAPLEEDKIIWVCTKGNGKFKGSRNLKSGNYTGSVIKFVTPEVENEMLIFVSIHYENFKDATWIKVIK